ncbi:MAG: TolC family protein [Parachlamydiales bacterium]|nr:TolC family protein [Parachlamydiales bacterium]
MSKIVHTCLLMCFVFPLWGNDDLSSLSLQKALEMAVDENEEYQIKVNDVDKSIAQYREIQSTLLPQVAGDVTWVRNFKYPKDMPHSASIRDFTLDYGISANQIITTFGKISSLLKGSKKMEQAAVFQKENTRQEVLFSTKVMYYNVLCAHEMLDVMQQSYNSTRRNKEILFQRSREGRVSKRDNIKIDADIAARVPMIASAETSYNTATETLKKQLGMEPVGSIELSSEYPEVYPFVDSDEALSQMLANHPLLKAMKLVSEGQEYFVKNKKAYYYPTLSGFARYNYKGASNDDFYVGDVFLRYYATVGINLQVPLTTSITTMFKVKQARMDQMNTELSYKKIHKQLTLELEKSLLEYNELIKVLPAQKEALSLAQQSFIMSQELLKSGQISLTDLNDAEMMLTSQKMKTATTLFKLNVALAKIEMLTGREYAHE